MVVIVNEIEFLSNTSYYNKTLTFHNNVEKCEYYNFKADKIICTNMKHIDNELFVNTSVKELKINNYNINCIDRLSFFKLPSENKLDKIYVRNKFMKQRILDLINSETVKTLNESCLTNIKSSDIITRIEKCLQEIDACNKHIESKKCLIKFVTSDSSKRIYMNEINRYELLIENNRECIKRYEVEDEQCLLPVIPKIDKLAILERRLSVLEKRINELYAQHMISPVVPGSSDKLDVLISKVNMILEHLE